MNKFVKTLTILLTISAVLLPQNTYAKSARTNIQQKKPATTQTHTTSSDAVIFKIHDITPIKENGLITGCDYYITLYNRTAINFRTFTINLDWADNVEDEFKFDRYVEASLGKDAIKEQKELFKDKYNSSTTKTSSTINAFGVDKQISIKSYIETEKCYLLLKEPKYTISPCEMARNIKTAGAAGLGSKEQTCDSLFEYVGSTNPEYFGDFKKMSLSDQEAINVDLENQELADIDVVIGEIVENMGTSDKTLSEIE